MLMQGHVTIAQEALMQLAHTSSLARFSAVALFGFGALAAPACRSTTPVAAAAPGTASTPLAAAAAAPAGPPVAVNCGAGLQALIRPMVVAGQAVSQVDCVPIAGAVAAPVGYAAAAGSAPAMAAGYVEEPVVYQPVQAPRRVVRAVQYEQPRVVRRKSGRTWQKSAVIIGSSAGIGAATGAAFKGKKGALIGAAIGGGAATLWDQATRK
jgi:hypothetical protein